MEGFISIPGTTGGLRCLACGADTHEPEEHLKRCPEKLNAVVKELIKALSDEAELRGALLAENEELRHEIGRLRTKFKIEKKEFEA